MGNYRMMTKTYVFLLFQIVLVQTIYGQRIWGKGDFCSKQNGQERIGQKVKIWSIGGIYTSINSSNNLKWPTYEMKNKSGENSWGHHYPKTGDTGTIIHVFEYDDGRVASAKLIYLLDIKGSYVPIGCGYITTVDHMDENEESEHWRIQDSIRSVKYAAGCEFKTKGLNDCWNRTGVFPIDTMPEIFICNLKSSGIDTLILCKYIYDNGSLPIEKAFVLWIDNGKGYMKAYYNNKNHQPTEKKVQKFEVGPLVQKFFEYKLDTVTTYPKAEYCIDHYMGYSIQLYTPTTFFCDRVVDYLINTDKKHPKSLWWTLVTDGLK
jgi:hypothetical protein